jgi:acetyl-CoA acetyltransferase
MPLGRVCEPEEVARAVRYLIVVGDYITGTTLILVVREAVKRAGIKPEEVEHVVFGNVIHTDVHDMYLARVAAVNGGIPVETPALTLNRLCGSGLQAIVSAAQAIYMGDATVTIGGKYALVTMCIGGGQGIAAIFEAL